MFTGEDVRLLRIIKSIPQKALAKKAGVSQAAVSKIEHSKKVFDRTFGKYSKAANCPIEEFEKVKKALPPPDNSIADLKRLLQQKKFLLNLCNL